MVNGQVRGEVAREADLEISPELGDRSAPVRQLYRIPEAMQLLSMSRSVIYEQIRAGRLRSVTQGRARFIPAAALNDYINLLVDESRGSYREPA
jgi:excisionase family DNA binding protein